MCCIRVTDKIEVGILKTMIRKFKAEIEEGEVHKIIYFSVIVIIYTHMEVVGYIVDLILWSLRLNKMSWSHSWWRLFVLNY